MFVKITAPSGLSLMSTTVTCFFQIVHLKVKAYYCFCRCFIVGVNSAGETVSAVSFTEMITFQKIVSHTPY